MLGYDVCRRGAKIAERTEMTCGFCTLQVLMNVIGVESNPAFDFSEFDPSEGGLENLFQPARKASVDHQREYARGHLLHFLRKLFVAQKFAVLGDQDILKDSVFDRPISMSGVKENQPIVLGDALKEPPHACKNPPLWSIRVTQQAYVLKIVSAS